MSAKLLVSSLLAMACLGSTSLGHAQHDVRAFLSPEGMDFVAKEIPSFLPSAFNPALSVASVGCINFEQSDSTISIDISELTVAVPRSGSLRVELQFSMQMSGELYAENIYGCLGEAFCQDEIDIRKGSAVFEYEISILDGNPKATPIDVSFTILPEDTDLTISGCGATGKTLDDLLGFAEDWLLIALEATLTDLASEKLGPYLEGLFGGFSADGTVGIASYNASLQDLDVEPDGMRFRIEGDMVDAFDAAPCVAEFDNGGPKDFDGLTPIIDGPNASHIGLAVNLGMVNKALYTVWRRGLMCLTEQHLQAFGLALDLNLIGNLLPGFPAGTVLSLDMQLSKYPKVRPEESEGGTITVELTGILLNIHGDRPDGSRNTLHAEVDVEATATLVVDPLTNAIVANLNGAKIFRMVLEDERDAAGAGFDVTRIIQLVEDHILPDVLDEVGTISLTGPTFAFTRYAIILRNLLTSDAFLTMGLDLFRIPETDDNAPNTTIVNAPTGPTTPHNAIVQVLGDDLEIPAELLQYQVHIDGVLQAPSFVQTIQVGEAGVSATYHISAAAVDLAGNVDPSPVEADVVVDGVSPVISVVGERIRAANEGPVEISWNMSDDQSSSQSLGIRVEIYELVDPADALSTVLIDTQMLSPGATSTQVSISGNKRVYRVELHVVDEAGNDSIASLLLTNPCEGGCSIGGKAGHERGALWLLALAFLALAGRRERTALRR